MKVLNTNRHREFDNYVDMLRDIREFVAASSDAEIAVNDDPKKLWMGFRDVSSGREWRCQISKIRRTGKDSNCDLLKEFNLFAGFHCVYWTDALVIVERREKVAEFLNSGR